MSHTIATTFQQFCEQFDFKSCSLGEGCYLAHFGGKNGKWAVFCYIADTCFRCYSVLPVTVPNEKQWAVMEYLTRVNYGLPIGNFEMDLRDAEVRYKSSVDMADAQLTPSMVAALVFRNLVTSDRYLKGLLHVLYADQEPATAIRAIESAVDDEEPDADDLDELLGDVNLDELPDLGDD